MCTNLDKEVVYQNRIILSLHTDNLYVSPSQALINASSLKHSKLC